jgi:hypothetical protein
MSGLRVNQDLGPASIAVYFAKAHRRVVVFAARHTEENDSI